MGFTACTARQFALSMQFMVVYQCNVAQANMTAFFVDGSTLSNLQVRHSVCYALWGVRFSCRQCDGMLVNCMMHTVSCEDGTNELPYLFDRPLASMHPTFLPELLQWSPKFTCMPTGSCHYHTMCTMSVFIFIHLFMPVFTS